MLPRLTTITKALEDYDDVQPLERGAYPIYGSLSALIRSGDTSVTEVVDLSGQGGSGIETDFNEVEQANLVIILSATTLEAVSVALPYFKPLIEADYPLTLRNTITIGDLLTEAPRNNLFLTAYAALDERVAVGFEDDAELERYFEHDPEMVKHQHIISYLPFYEPQSITFDKVSRTPSDAPIVGAVRVVNHEGEPVTAICGIAPYPVIYTPGMTSTIDDYKGSAEYRTAMAAYLYNRLNAADPDTTTERHST